jgi:CubicO group peptidase (beta-lactamase class C family)
MAAAYAPKAPERSTANLDDVLRTAVEQRRVPGVVAMVVTADAVPYRGAFGIDNVPPDKQPRLRSVYQRQEDGALAEQPRPPAKPVEFFSGGGGLHSTAEDYLKFTRAIYNTFFWIDRDKNVCAVFMTQMLPFLDDGPKALMDDFDRAVYAWRDGSAQ